MTDETPALVQEDTELPAHVAAQMWKLRRWANRVRGRYGVPIYLCGSALRADNPDPRDWDVRIMLPDDEFALRFGPVDEWRHEGGTGQWTRTRFRWSDQCVKDTNDFNAWCHLPGDVQIYPESHAAIMYADLPRLRIDTFPDEAEDATPTRPRREEREMSENTSCAVMLHDLDGGVSPCGRPEPCANHWTGDWRESGARLFLREVASECERMCRMAIERGDGETLERLSNWPFRLRALATRIAALLPPED